MKTEIYSLPAYWAGALINDDTSDLNSWDEEKLKEFQENNPEVLHCVGTTEEEQYFSNYRGTGCDMLNYIFAVKED